MVLKEFKPLVIVHHNIKTPIHTLAFSDNSATIKTDWLHVQREGQPADTHLCYFFCALLNGLAVMRCGAADTHQRLDDLSAAMRWVLQRTNNTDGQSENKLKVSVVQLGMPDNEWGAIEHQQWLLMRHSLLHEVTGPYVNMPSPFFFLQASAEESTTMHLKMIHKLSRQINCMSWLHYSDWIEAEMRRIAHAMAYDALDQYQLAASIADFSHEVESLFLHDYRQQIREATLVLGDAEFEAAPSAGSIDYQALTQMQKRVININSDIFANLQRQAAILGYMVERIALIELSHPEILKLKQAAVLFRTLLESQTDPFGSKRIAWGKQLLLHCLLDAHLNVTSLVTCSLDQERATFVFAIKVAVLQVIQQLGYTAMFELAIHWDETVIMANQLIAQKGMNALEDWLREVETSSVKQHIATLRFLRQYILGNLHSLALPRTVICLEEGRVNSEYLNFLPAHIILDKQEIPFVLYDTSGVPTHLSEKGQQLMARLLAVF